MGKAYLKVYCSYSGLSKRFVVKMITTILDPLILETPKRNRYQCKAQKARLAGLSLGYWTATCVREVASRKYLFPTIQISKHHNLFTMPKAARATVGSARVGGSGVKRFHFPLRRSSESRFTGELTAYCLLYCFWSLGAFDDLSGADDAPRKLPAWASLGFYNL